MMHLRKVPALTVSILAVAAGFLTGCTSNVERVGSPAGGSAFVASANNQVSAVSISLNDDAKDDFKDNPRFDPEMLRADVEKNLKVSGLLDGSKKGTAATVEIVVTGVRVRSAAAAILVGVMAGVDKLNGDVIIRDNTGREIDRFHVSAMYSLGGFAGGDETRLDWLYDTFSKKTLAAITGSKG